MTLSTSEILAEMFTEITQKTILPIKNDQNVYIQNSIAELTLIEALKARFDGRKHLYLLIDGRALNPSRRKNNGNNKSRSVE